MAYLSALYEHPVKSARGIEVTEALVLPEGLSRDRRFLVHTGDGTFVSGRSHPSLVLIQPEWDGTTLRLTAPGMDPFEAVVSSERPCSVAVWKDRFQSWDQTDAAAAWLSSVLKDEVRLAWLGESQRPLRWDRERRLTFADAAPLLALGSPSVEDLSFRVGEPLSVRRFRPNLVLEGLKPYEEDHWLRIRVGEVEFLHLDGCGRCEFTTIDPETAERHPQGEPVATLERFRRVDTGIYFGMNLMPLSSGVVRVGDAVTVLESRQSLVFGPFALPPSMLQPWPEGPAELVCTAVQQESREVKTFVFDRSDGLTYGWKAGQYITLKLLTDHGPLRRSYSISSAPGQPLSITVKRIEGGWGSSWLHDRVAPGLRLTAEAIGGHFTLEDHPWPTILLLGAGSGITPLMAIVRRVVQSDWPVTIAFHQTVRFRDDALFTEELLQMASVPGTRLTLGTRITSEQGRLDHQTVVRFCPDLRDRKVFVCGPSGFRSSVRGLLAGAGLKVDRRYVEELFGEAALEVPEQAVPGIVSFVQSGKQVNSDGQTTVLQLAERAGINLPSSCRSGDCGTCRVKASAGDWVLACHTFPQGDLSIEI